MRTSGVFQKSLIGLPPKNADPRHASGTVYAKRTLTASHTAAGPVARSLATLTLGAHDTQDIVAMMSDAE